MTNTIPAIPSRITTSFRLVLPTLESPVLVESRIRLVLANNEFEGARVSLDVGRILS